MRSAFFLIFCFFIPCFSSVTYYQNFVYDYSHTQNNCEEAVTCLLANLGGSGRKAMMISYQSSGEKKYHQAFYSSSGITDSAWCEELHAAIVGYGNMSYAYSGHCTYPGQVSGCRYYDSTMCEITSMSCFELGNENPDKPLNVGAPMTNGIWVYVVAHKNKLVGGCSCPDSSFKTVISNGCSGITLEGIPLAKQNARDSVYTVDGVNLHKCNYNGVSWVGTCAQNGYDTSCGGQVPFSYGSSGDSIINDCRFSGGEPPNIDPSFPKDSLSISGNPDSAVIGGDFQAGLNKLLDKSDTSVQLQKASKSTLDRILGGIVDMGRNVFDGFSSLGNKILSIGDSLRIDSTGSGVDTTRMGNYDSSAKNFVPGSIDSSGMMSRLYSKLDSNNDETSDTLITRPDTSQLRSLFAPFVVSFGDTSSCPCDSEAFPVNFQGHTSYINVCKYDISIITKPLFNLIAVFIVFVFYRNWLFKIIMGAFKK